MTDSSVFGAALLAATASTKINVLSPIEQRLLASACALFVPALTASAVRRGVTSSADYSDELSLEQRAEKITERLIKLHLRMPPENPIFLSPEELETLTRYHRMNGNPCDDSETFAGRQIKLW